MILSMLGQIKSKPGGKRHRTVLITPGIHQVKTLQVSTLKNFWDVDWRDEFYRMLTGRLCRVIRKDNHVDRVSVKRSFRKDYSFGSLGGLAYSA